LGEVLVDQVEVLVATHGRPVLDVTQVRDHPDVWVRVDLTDERKKVRDQRGAYGTSPITAIG
jgi:hypothetical protein